MLFIPSMDSRRFFSIVLRLQLQSFDEFSVLQALSFRDAVVDVVSLVAVTFEVGDVVDAVVLEVGAVVDTVALEVGAVVDAVALEVVALEVGDVVDAEEFSSPRVITLPLRSSDTAKNCDQ